MTRTFKVRALDNTIEARLYVATPEAEISDARLALEKAEEALRLFGATKLILAGNKHGIYVAGFIPGVATEKVEELTHFGFVRRDTDEIAKLPAPWGN